MCEATYQATLPKKSNVALVTLGAGDLLWSSAMVSDNHIDFIVIDCLAQHILHAFAIDEEDLLVEWPGGVSLAYRVGGLLTNIVDTLPVACLRIQ